MKFYQRVYLFVGLFKLAGQVDPGWAPLFGISVQLLTLMHINGAIFVAFAFAHASR